MLVVFTARKSHDFKKVAKFTNRRSCLTFFLRNVSFLVDESKMCTQAKMRKRHLKFSTFINSFTFNYWNYLIIFIWLYHFHLIKLNSFKDISKETSWSLLLLKTSFSSLFLRARCALMMQSNSWKKILSKSLLALLAYMI